MGMIWYQSPGHMLSETDLICRKVFLDQELNSSRPIVMFHPTEQGILAGNVIKNSGLNIEVIITEYAFQYQREISVFYPELVIQGGFWDFSVQTSEKPNHEHNLYFLQVGNYDQVFEFQRKYFESVSKTRSFNVYKKYYEEILCNLESKKDFFGFLDEKPYITIQNKYTNPSLGVWNGGAETIPIETFDEVLSYATDMGFRIIQSGREEFPELYKKFNVYDYPRSKFCTFENDFILAGKAKAGIVMASGMGFIYDFLGTEMLNVGFWTPQPFHYANSTLLPARIISKSSQRILSFKEQCLAVKERFSPQAYVFKMMEDVYYPEPLKSDLIKESFEEIIMPNPQSKINKEIIRMRARNEDTQGFWSASSCFLPGCINEFYENYLP